MTKKMTIFLLALTVVVGAFFIDNARLVANGKQLSCPWDVDATIVYGTDKFVYRLSDNVQQTDKQVCYLGHSAKKRLYNKLVHQGLPMRAVCNYLFGGFDKLLDHFAYVNVDKVDATVSFDGQFCYRKGVDGKSVDVAKLCRLLLDGVGSKVVVNLPVVTHRAITVQELQQKTVLKGKYTTYCNTNVQNRCFNIQKCCKTLNATVVLPGQKFSFNDIVGPRTEQLGYKNAVVIVDGKYTEGVGGGVCQVSSTLYNALLLSNVVPCSCRHSLVAKYVPVGFDAMVSYGVADLTFVNTTDSVLYIAVRFDNNAVTAEVYGVPNTYQVQLQSVAETVPFQTIFVADKTVAAGQQKVVQNGIDGAVCKSYALYYKDGQFVYKQLLREDVYKRVDKVVHVPAE